jgi:Tfp pilus assembly protein PilF
LSKADPTRAKVDFETALRLDPKDADAAKGLKHAQADLEAKRSTKKSRR